MSRCGLAKRRTVCLVRISYVSLRWESSGRGASNLEAVYRQHFYEGEVIMAKKGPRQLIKMRSTESAHMYLSVKNRRNDPNRLELKKYDPTLRRHVVYREAK